MRSVSLSMAVFCLSLVFSSAAEAESVRSWNKNYKRMVAILEGASRVGQCGVSLSGDPNAPKGSFLVNFLMNPGGLTSYGIVPPAATKGRTRVTNEANHIIKYSESDMAGWVNLVIQLNESENAVVGISINKTLPSEQIYETVLSCKASQNTVSAQYPASNSVLEGKIEAFIKEGRDSGAIVNVRTLSEADLKTVCIDFKDRGVAYANVRPMRDLTDLEQGASTAFGDLCSK